MKRLLSLLLVIGLTACTSPKKTSSKEPLQEKVQEINLSPGSWGTGELQRFLEMDNRQFPDNDIAEGFNGAVTNTYHAAASRAGLEALKQGGTSVDAAMTASLTQVTLNAGAVISFFGIMNMVHYDASTGEMISMDATWNTVQEEKDPMSIPGGIRSASALDLYKAREVSGRSALVGGFMKGLEEAHHRYGKLPFNQLFEPAIHLAEKGFELSVPTAMFFKHRDQQIRRLPDTRATLVKPNGQGYVAGDLFQQPELAGTLRKLAQKGSDYMYKGEWGEKAIKRQ